MITIPIVKTLLHQPHIPAIVSSMGIRIRRSVRLNPHPVVIAPHQQLHTINATQHLNTRMIYIIVLSLETNMLESVKRRQHLNAIVPQQPLHTIVAMNSLNQQVRSIIVLSLEIYMLESVKQRVHQHKHAQITQLEIPVPRVVVLRKATIPVQLLMILL